MSRTFNGITLDDDALAICAQFGNDPAQFAALLAARRAGRPLVLSARTANREKAPSGIIGPPIAEEAYYEHRKEIESPSIDSESLAREAQKSIAQFLAKPDAPDAWKILARASAMLTGALDRIGPAYADRVNPRANLPGKNESQWV